jgi:hypothetical protein
MLGVSGSFGVRNVNWRRLGERSLIAGMIVVATVQLVNVATRTQYGFDFRGGTWQAGHPVLVDRSTYGH